MRALRQLAVSGLVLASLFPLSPAAAQTWPQRTVRLMIPLPPGTGADLAGRMLAEQLASRWGQPVVVENRQGGDGIPAVQAFLGARDNHTLLMSFAGIVTINPLLSERLPYNPADLIPVVPVIDTFLGAAVSTTMKADSLADLVRAAKTQPGKLNWAATPGIPYYAMLALMKSAGIDMVQVSYRDFVPAVQDLGQGRLHVAATSVPFMLPHHRAETLKLIFVTNTERSPQAPNVPTAREAGYPEIVFDGIIGIYGWRDMPAEIKNRVVKDVQAITADAGFRAKVAASGSVSRSGSSSDFVAAIEAQRNKIAEIHKTTLKR